MELNGVANLQMILERVDLDAKTRERVSEQLEVLNRYMTAIGDVLHKNNIEVPKWHEVRDNRAEYPTLSEKFKN